MSTQNPVYANDHASSVMRTHSWRTVDNSAAYLKPHIKPDMKILDVGCGPGSITVDLASRVPNGQVIGIEYVSDPLDQARELATEKGVSNVEFCVGDIYSLDYPDDHFDIVHVHQVLQHLADPIKAIQEMRRVVKPNGGFFAAREAASFTWYPDFPSFPAWQELTFKLVRDRGGDPCSGSRIHTWAAKGGFEKSKIQCSAGSWCFNSPEERVYWGGSMGERCTSSGFSKLAIDGGYATAEDLERMAKDWEDFKNHDDSWFGILHGEIICWK
ncbi:hypothetical protein FQN54_006097 [Arachnomyces sp. PD_36]|nr:hypothetical protein FQN54_006097 [Arachnomyces sp. PD_36]